MTNKEIDKLLTMLDKKTLVEVKKYLYNEKDKIRQKTFEKYLTNNKFGSDLVRMPKLFFSMDKQCFTNGVSLYEINSNFFNTNTSNLSIQKNRKRTYNHRFEIKDEMQFNVFFDVLMEKYGLKETNPIEMSLAEEKKYTYVKYFDEESNQIEIRRFDTDEIDKCNIFLNNPKYNISTEMPILYAENDIGKVYILGYKNSMKQ